MKTPHSQTPHTLRLAWTWTRIHARERQSGCNRWMRLFDGPRFLGPLSSAAAPFHDTELADAGPIHSESPPHSLNNKYSELFANIN